MSNIDIYSIITNGIITTEPNTTVYDGIGYFVVVEVEPPTPPPIVVSDGGGGGIFDQVYDEIPKVKKYTLRVSFDDAIEDYIKTIDVSDPSVRVSNVLVNRVDNTISVTLSNINTNDIVNEIKINIY